MLHKLAKQTFLLFALATIASGSMPVAARAQSSPAALPTAPGADRAISGGLTQAHASLPGGPGLSPLEPYLVLWLLPLSGLLTVFAGIYVDRRTQARAGTSKNAVIPLKGGTRRSA
jgi:hypothetical protein